MRKIPKLLLTSVLTLFITQVYAIDVDVQSTSKNITGLGFTVNGSKHGGLGSSYHGKDMPKGSYVFGVRKGKDITCFVKGKKFTKLTENTKATLMLKGRHCTAELQSQ
jgi:hypothetical protein